MPLNVAREEDFSVIHEELNELQPIFPTIAPMKNSEGEVLPFIASDTVTVFSIFSTDTGAVDSYYFDTTKQNSSVIHFDRFYLGQNKSVDETIFSIKDIQESAK
jgi:hypothetical protein